MNKIKQNEWEIVIVLAVAVWQSFSGSVEYQRMCTKARSKVPGAERLLCGLGGCCKCAPILESGEIEGAWAMIMPPECSFEET